MTIFDCCYPLHSVYGAGRKGDVQERSIRFNPRCSFWGLMCVLLLLHRTYTPDDLFNDFNTPPSLAAETLQVCVKQANQFVVAAT